MKPSEFLSKYECEKIEKVNTVDEWIKVTCEELDANFISKEEIKEIIGLIENNEGLTAWKKMGFTPYDYNDVLKTLKWVLK